MYWLVLVNPTKLGKLSRKVLSSRAALATLRPTPPPKKGKEIPTIERTPKYVIKGSKVNISQDCDGARL